MESDMRQHPKGFTLVELMIVVAIIGVLGALGAVAYQRSVTSAKINKLVMYATEIKGKQQDHVSKHGSYWPIDDGIDSVLITGASSDAAKLPFEQILGMEAPNETDMRVQIWTASSDAMGACPAPCPITPAETPWFVVSVSRNLDGNLATPPTTAYIATGMAEPDVINRGQ